MTVWWTREDEALLRTFHLTSQHKPLDVRLRRAMISMRRRRTQSLWKPAIDVRFSSATAQTSALDQRWCLHHGCSPDGTDSPTDRTEWVSGAERDRRRVTTVRARLEILRATNLAVHRELCSDVDCSRCGGPRLILSPSVRFPLTQARIP